MISSHGSAGWRYPYLVTSTPDVSPVQSNHGSLTNLLEDVEMGNPEPQTGKRYIALDTNILIDHLNMVRQLYTVLNKASPCNHALLIPSTVINELDGLKVSTAPAGTTPDGPVTKGDLAKAATRWLLDITRTTRDPGQGCIRFQKWSEHNDANLVKGDDKILDCCLFFAKSSHVTLWSNDQNLLLLAESNDVPTVRGYTAIRLEHIIRDLDIQTNGEDMLNVRKDVSPMSILYGETRGDDMELDDQYLPSPDPPSLLSSSNTLANLGIPSTYDRRSSASSTLLSHSPTSPTLRPTPLPTTRLPTPLLDRLASIMTATLTIIRPDTTTDNDLNAILKTCIGILLELEKTTERPSEPNMQLLQSISALRTISTFTDIDTMTRRPRIGQVADAIESLGSNFRFLGIFGNDAEFRLLAMEIRKLP